MIYIEMQLGGQIHIYEQSHHLLLLRTSIAARAERLPVPSSFAEALAYLSANCYQLEIFDTLNEALAWAEGYIGFRAGEVRAELDRFAIRSAEHQALIAAAGMVA